MATQVVMPKLSPTMEEGQLSRWLKKEGDQVSVGEPIAEVETCWTFIARRTMPADDTLLPLTSQSWILIGYVEPLFTAFVGSYSRQMLKLTDNVAVSLLGAISAPPLNSPVIVSA